MQHLEESIRERAYHLWIADGRPEGRADAYWLNAQREILTASVDTRHSETALAAALQAAAVAPKPEKKAKVARPRKAKSSAA